jgi:hypothetical protein
MVAWAAVGGTLGDSIDWGTVVSDPDLVSSTSGSAVVVLLGEKGVGVGGGVEAYATDGCLGSPSV